MGDVTRGSRTCGRVPGARASWRTGDCRPQRRRRVAGKGVRQCTELGSGGSYGESHAVAGHVPRPPQKQVEN